ncbi:hypothetical protein HYY69_05790 [Candidatus Woesearchaeota archaeon]|nr:hypothetical protein [Candidatus Woesearchaeota archaeon]
MDIDNLEKTKGTLTCPTCKHKQSIEIPTSSCLAFYQCKGCNKIIPAEKSCCVFCDYGDRKCPVAKEHIT